MNPPSRQQALLDQALKSLAEGRGGEAAGSFRELAHGSGVPGPERVLAARTLIREGRPEDRALALRLLGEVEPEHADWIESRRLYAELLEKGGPGGPSEAAERARAHQAAALGGGDEEAARHLRGMFRALVRLAELEAEIPRVDPRIPGAEALEAALKAHRRWRTGGSPAAAAEAYQEALAGPVPVAVRPYLLYWRAHLLGVAGHPEASLAAFQELLRIGPPGRNGRADVEARIAQLEASVRERPDEGLEARVEELRTAGKGREALELLETALHRAGTPEATLRLRKLLARTLTGLGERDLARQQWEAIRRLEAGSPAPAPDPDPGPAEEVVIEAAATPHHLPATREATQVETVDEARDRARDKARHQAELARRLDEAGSVRDAVLALRGGYLASPPGPERDRLVKRAAAMAWHRLRDPALAMEALAELGAGERAAPDVARLEEALRAGVIERLEQQVRVGLRATAFRQLAALWRSLEPGEPLRAALLAFHLEKLSANVYRRFRLRVEEVEAELKGFTDRGVGAWDLVRLPDEAKGSPRHLATLRQEARVLGELEASLRHREEAALAGSDVVGVARRMEDPEGLLAMEAILVFAREVAERQVAKGAESPVTTARDRLLAWLPDAAKGIFMSRSGRSLDAAWEDLVGQFEAFLDQRYG